MSDYIQIANISGNHFKDYIQIANISGHSFDNNISMYKDDFYTLCMKDPKDNIGLRKKGMIVFKKQNVDLGYLNSDLVRFCLSIFKNNQHNDGGSMSMIPKLPIPISEELEQYIREYISDYYGIRNNNGSVWSKNIRTYNPNLFHCQLASIRGNVIQNSHGKEIVKDSFYTMCMKGNENEGIRITNLSKPGNPVPTFEFQTLEERNNFIKYLKTDFARFCLSLLKNNCDLSVGNMDMIPWLDFTEEWDDDKLYSKFNISQDLQDYIKDFLPDYYGIRNSVK